MDLPEPQRPQDQGSSAAPVTGVQLQTLREMRLRAAQGGGAKRIEQQHARGRLTARERLDVLLDDGSFQELGALATHSVSDGQETSSIAYGEMLCLT